MGEVACTGLHGANRLASNSLMECLVFAHRLREIELGPVPAALASDKTQPLALDLDGCSSSHLIDAIEQLRQLCWRRAGWNDPPLDCARPSATSKPTNNIWSSRHCSRHCYGKTPVPPGCWLKTAGAI